ncbi:MAG: hypothetical protein ACI861_001056 [Paracoccaceae bacterium]|jgi:hypothetical protein
MSIWIFDRFPVKTISLLLCVASVSACGSSRLGTVSRAPAPKNSIEVSGQTLNVKGPPGFCIDRETSQFSPDLAFVLLGNCRVVSPSAFAASPKVKALLTASISGTNNGASISGSLESIDNFFRSETGRTALSRDADPATVDVLETFQQDQTFFIRATDRSEGVVPDAAQDYWRAYFDVNDQIVSVSVIGFQTDPITPEIGLSTVREFAGLIKSQNGIPTEPIQTAAVEEQIAAEPPKKKKRVTAGNAFWTLGLLRKLIN